jgi:hypothetical protein
MHGTDENVCILVEKFGRMGTHARLTPRWEDNIKTNLKETGWKGVDYTHLPQNMNQ